MDAPRFEFGAEVRTMRDLRDDGTYPGAHKGSLLVPQGAVGVVRDIGTFLQDQVIYTVHFLAEDRLVGCRERELVSADLPFVPHRFAPGDIVTPAMPLGIDGAVVAGRGSAGEVVTVIGDAPGGIAYHVDFDGRLLQVPETALLPAGGLVDG